MLANTIYVVSAFFIAGWIGIGLAMFAEFSVLSRYLKHHLSKSQIRRRFIIGNIVSTAAGIPIAIWANYGPDGSPWDNFSNLWIGAGIAYGITVAVEVPAFLFKSPKCDLRAILTAVILANVASYATVIAVHLLQLYL